MDQNVLTCETCSDLERRGTGPLERIRAARARRKFLEDLERDAVLAARDAGHSWEEVAAALGTSRQAAWQRWGRTALEPSSNGNGDR